MVLNILGEIIDDACLKSDSFKDTALSQLHVEILRELGRSNKKKISSDEFLLADEDENSLNITPVLQIGEASDIYSESLINDSDNALSFKKFKHEPIFKLFTCKDCCDTFDNALETLGHGCITENTYLTCSECSARVDEARKLENHSHNGNSILFVSVVTTRSQSLCSRNCDNRCAEVGQDILDKINKDLIIKTKSELHQFLLDKLVTQQQYGHFPDYFVLEQQKFCYGFMSMFGLTKYMLSKVRREYDEGKKIVVHGNLGKTYYSEKRDRAIAFIEQFSVIHCEHSPDKVQRVLPGYMNIRTIYSSYQGMPIKCKSSPEIEKAIFYFHFVQWDSQSKYFFSLNFTKFTKYFLSSFAKHDYTHLVQQRWKKYFSFSVSYIDQKLSQSKNPSLFL